MAIRFSIDQGLLSQARKVLEARSGLYWIIGGAGSGKTSVCQALSTRYGLPVYDMDAQIYGTYHGRFIAERHPVNWAWSTAGDGLAWLLAMSWENFDNFNRAALPEYLDLLTSDLEAIGSGTGMLVDGGVCNPAVLAQAMPSRQIACLAAATGSSTKVWDASEERKAMKAAVYELADGEAAWRRFLEFDQRINTTLLKECLEKEIPVCLRNESESIDDVAARVASLLGIV